MTERVISPSGPGACEAGLLIDETGERFVVLTFREPDADPVIVTFTAPLFDQYMTYLERTAAAAKVEANWAIGR